MTGRVEVPFAPRPNELRGTHVEPPWVPIEYRWEYKELVRDAESGELPTEAELNALGRGLGAGGHSESGPAGALLFQARASSLAEPCSLDTTA
jgi:hypothetical protein